jgi:hypothetical protein
MSEIVEKAFVALDFELSKQISECQSVLLKQGNDALLYLLQAIAKSGESMEISFKNLLCEVKQSVMVELETIYPEVFPTSQKVKTEIISMGHNEISSPLKQRRPRGRPPKSQKVKTEIVSMGHNEISSPSIQTRPKTFQ